MKNDKDFVSIFLIGMSVGMFITSILVSIFKVNNLDIKVSKIEVLDGNKYELNGRFITTNIYNIGDDLIPSK